MMRLFQTLCWSPLQWISWYVPRHGWNPFQHTEFQLPITTRQIDFLKMLGPIQRAPCKRADPLPPSNFFPTNISSKRGDYIDPLKLLGWSGESFVGTGFPVSPPYLNFLRPSVRKSVSRSTLWLFWTDFGLFASWRLRVSHKPTKYELRWCPTSKVINLETTQTQPGRSWSVP